MTTYKEVEQMSNMLNKFYQSALHVYKDEANANVRISALHAEESENNQNTIMLNINLEAGSIGLGVLNDDFNISNWLKEDTDLQHITTLDLLNNNLKPSIIAATMKKADDIYSSVIDLYNLQEVINKYDKFSAMQAGIKDREENDGIAPEQYQETIDTVTEMIKLVNNAMTPTNTYYPKEFIQDFADYTNNLNDYEKLILSNHLAWSEMLYKLTNEDTYNNPANYLISLISYSWDFMKYEKEKGHKTFSELAKEHYSNQSTKEDDNNE